VAAAQRRVDVLFVDERASDVQVGGAIEMKVTQTEPGVKGDTASGGRQVGAPRVRRRRAAPLHRKGEMIRVDTRSRYCSAPSGVGTTDELHLFGRAGLVAVAVAVTTTGPRSARQLSGRCRARSLTSRAASTSSERCETRGSADLDADPSQSVTEALAVTGGGDQLAGDAVDVFVLIPP
jgi:hypothetical protein